MIGRDYKNIANKFQQLRGLLHSKTQLKNKWESLKHFYSFWLWCNKETRLGRTPTGGIAAGDNFWKTHTKVQLPFISCFYSLDCCMMVHINVVNIIYFL
jgi:hypothetical protein